MEHGKILDIVLVQETDSTLGFSLSRSHPAVRQQYRTSRHTFPASPATASSEATAVIITY